MYTGKETGVKCGVPVKASCKRFILNQAQGFGTVLAHLVRFISLNSFGNPSDFYKQSQEETLWHVQSL